MQKKLFSSGPLSLIKTLIVFSILCTLTLLIACKSPESPEEVSSIYYLSGTVTDKATELPIVGASVSVHNPAVAKTTTTDTDGHYSIIYDGPGRWNPGAGMASSWLEVVSSGNHEVGLEYLPATAGTYTIDFQLTPTE